MREVIVAVVIPVDVFIVSFGSVPLLVGLFTFIDSFIVLLILRIPCLAIFNLKDRLVHRGVDALGISVIRIALGTLA
jgi:hypothetical protein